MIKVISFKSLVRSFTFFCITCCLLLMTQGYCYAQEVSSRGLLNNAERYDGAVVHYEGEIIGDIMQRKAGVWVNMSDGNAAIGIWLTSEMANKISYAGAHKTTGDLFLVTGVFNKACQEHGGDLDIHGKEFVLIRQGAFVKEKKSEIKTKFALTLSGILFAVIAFQIYSIMKRKRLGA